MHHPPQRPSYVWKSGWVCWLWLLRDARRCGHPLCKNIWHASPLSRGRGVEAVVAGMTKSLLHPRRGGLEKNPRDGFSRVAAPPLPDSGASSSTTAGAHKGVIMTQGDGGSFERTCSSINVVKGLMHLLSSLAHSTNWCGSPVCGGLATFAQCCRAFV